MSDMNANPSPNTNAAVYDFSSAIKGVVYPFRKTNILLTARFKLLAKLSSFPINH